VAFTCKKVFDARKLEIVLLSETYRMPRTEFGVYFMNHGENEKMLMVSVVEWLDIDNN
jgi:hypothetical protein